MTYWVRNHSTKTGKATSQWHLYHSFRANERESFALTYCGYPFDNPRFTKEVPQTKSRYNNRCIGCGYLAYALETTTQVPDELVDFGG